MIPTIVLDRAATPGGEMVLSRHGDDFAIRVGGVELMSSRAHGSEDQLGAMTCARVASLPHPAVLVDDLAALRAKLEAAGHTTRDDTPIEGYARFFADDPFGNRLEFMQRT